MRRAACILAGLILQATCCLCVGVGSAASATITVGGVVLDTHNGTQGGRRPLVRRVVQISTQGSRVSEGAISSTKVVSSHITPHKGVCPLRWKRRGRVCEQSCKNTNRLGRSLNGQCKCDHDEDCLSGLSCVAGSCSSRPQKPCPDLWWEEAGICFQGCSRDDQHRDGDGRCLCGQALPNQDCFPGSSCNGGVCETPAALATSLASVQEDKKETGACADFSGYYQMENAAYNPLGFLWRMSDTWNPGICNTALPGPTGEDPDIVTLGLQNNHGYALPSIIEDIQGFVLKTVIVTDSKNSELDRKCCQQCAITPLCQWWSRQIGTGSRECKLGYAAGKHIKSNPQTRRGGWSPGPWCGAQFSGLTGTNVSSYTILGSSEKELDERCCSLCSRTLDCHFWIRESGWQNKIKCHLMKDPVTHYDHSEFRGGWRAGNPSRNYSYITLYSTGVYGDKGTDEETFNKACWKAPDYIIRRDCESCSSDHNVIFYRRYTFPKSFNFFYYLLTRFSSTDNEPHEDFDIFSSLEDAQLKRNPWQELKFGDDEVGFPGYSGPAVASTNEWNSLTKVGGAVSVRYSIPVYHPCQFGYNTTIAIRQDQDACDDIVAANPYLQVRSPYGVAEGNKLHMFDAYAEAITNITLKNDYGDVGAIKWPDKTLWVKQECYWFAGDYEAQPKWDGSSSVKCRQIGCEVTCMKESTENITGSAIGNKLSLPEMQGTGSLDGKLETVNWATSNNDVWKRAPPIP